MQSEWTISSYLLTDHVPTNPTPRLKYPAYPPFACKAAWHQEGILFTRGISKNFTYLEILPHTSFRHLYGSVTSHQDVF